MSTGTKPAVKLPVKPGNAAPVTSPESVKTIAEPEKVEDVTEEKKVKRPRPTQNYGKDFVFDSAEQAEKTIPLYEDGKPAENLSVHQITRSADNKVFHVWANTPQAALAFVVLNHGSYSWPEGQRGAKKKLNPHILKYAGLLKKMGDADSLAELEKLFAEEGDHYRAALAA